MIRDERGYCVGLRLRRHLFGRALAREHRRGIAAHFKFLADLGLAVALNNAMSQHPDSHCCHDVFCLLLFRQPNGFFSARNIFAKEI